jgi:hypothetical protein
VTGAELTDGDVRRARVAAQLLHRPSRRTTVTDLVTRLLAVQAQDAVAAPLALRARSRGLVAADVAAARDDRSVVRAWGPRGTLHLIAADDLPWLIALTGPTVVVGAMRRLGQEGVTGAAEELVEATERALAGQGPLTKVQLGERLETQGVRAHGQGLVHLAFLASAYGRVVLGPNVGSKPTYVHAADWLGRPLDLDGVDRHRALAELARRYLMTHAPAAPEDLATWSGLTLGAARTAWATIADEVTEVVHNGRPLWRPRRGAPKPAEVAVSLLPAFDEYLLGWRGRDLVLDPAHATTVIPGGGMLRPAVLADGRVIGTWQGNPARTTLFTPVDAEALLAEVADVARFLG